MDVLVVGADTETGRTVAEIFHAAGHRVVLSGPDAGKLNPVAGSIGADAVVCDHTDAADLARAAQALPRHLDAIVHLPSHGPDGDAATQSGSAERLAAAWRDDFERTVLAAVLTVAVFGDRLRSGGSVVTVAPPGSGEPGARSAAKAALAEWTTAQSGHLGARGITINTLAAGLPAPAGYDGLAGTTPTADAEIGRLALFLTTPAARHITGQTLHVGRGPAHGFAQATGSPD